MAIQLQSTNISLLFDYWPEPGEGAGLNELWQTFKRTAVEPSQAPSPDLVSFADECLLFAQIAVDDPAPTEGMAENNGTTRGGHTSESTSTCSTQRTPPPTYEERRLGLIYLHAGPANYPSREANLGVIIKPDKRGHGYAREAVQLVLGWAFEELKFHRVQTAILDTPLRDRVLRLFIGSGFVHEGTRRRAIFLSEGEGMGGMWKDVTYLAMLDTDWMLQSTWKQNNPGQDRPVPTVWDEMFTRHAKEQEELLKWEETHRRITRSSSTETLKENVRNAAPDLAYLTDDASSTYESSTYDSSPPSPRPGVVITWDTDSEMEDIYVDELRQQWGTRFDMEGALLRPVPLDRMLSIPSIPSTRLSEGNLQSPVSIRSTSTPGSSPPYSRSPSAPSSIHSFWMDSEEEDNWLPNEFPSSISPIQPPMPLDTHQHASRRGTASRSRSDSVSSAGSADSWSDAQSSFGASSSTSGWDIISDT